MKDMYRRAGLVLVLTMMAATEALAVQPPSGGTDRTADLGMFNDVVVTAWSWMLSYAFPLFAVGAVGVSAVHFWLRREPAALGYGVFAGLVLMAIPQIMDTLAVFGS